MYTNQLALRNLPNKCQYCSVSEEDTIVWKVGVVKCRGTGEMWLLERSLAVGGNKEGVTPA